jgi:hypothetical protein
LFARASTEYFWITIRAFSFPWAQFPLPKPIAIMHRRPSASFGPKSSSPTRSPGTQAVANSASESALLSLIDVQTL